MCVLDCCLDELSCSASPTSFALLLNPIRKINWQTVGVGFRTAAQVADGIARPGVNDSRVLR